MPYNQAFFCNVNTFLTGKLNIFWYPPEAQHLVLIIYILSVKEILMLLERIFKIIGLAKSHFPSILFSD